MAKSKSKSWFINWMKYCQAYLELARIGILELNEATHVPKNAFIERTIYKDKILLVPSIWCLKHAIELLFKALNIRITQEFSPVHDNSQLNNELKNSFSSLGIKNSTLLAELEYLSNKYYKLKFCNSFLASHSDISDDLNDVFRYPESKVSFVLDIGELHNVSQENQQELINDIERLNKLLLKLYSEITGAKIKRGK